MSRLLDSALSTHWAMTEDALGALKDLYLMAQARSGSNDAETIQQIMKENEDIGAALHIQTLESLSSKKGEPMEGTRYVKIVDGVAIIDMFGAIYPRANMMTASGATSLTQFTSDFIKAFNEESIRAIIINADSPGGDVRGLADTADIVFGARQSGQKPIETFVSGYCCSAMYYIAAATSKITASRSGSMIGSIGTVLTAYKKDDQTIEIVSNVSPYKRPDPATEEGRKVLAEQVDDLGDHFVNDTAKYRGITRKFVLENYGQGMVKIGPRAKSIGLVDDLGTLGELVHKLSTGTASKAKSSVVSAQAVSTIAAMSEADTTISDATKQLLHFTSKEKEDMSLKSLFEKFKASDETVLDDAAGTNDETAPAATTDEPAVVPVAATTAADLQAAALAATERRSTLADQYAVDGELFARTMIIDNRILPAEQFQAAADLINAKIDDAMFGGTVSMVVNGALAQGTREAAVRARYESSPKHGLTQSAVAGLVAGNTKLAVLPEAEPEKESAAEIMSEARRKQLLESSDQGQAVLANNANN